MHWSRMRLVWSTRALSCRTRQSSDPVNRLWAPARSDCFDIGAERTVSKQPYRELRTRFPKVSDREFATPSRQEKMFRTRGGKWAMERRRDRPKTPSLISSPVALRRPTLGQKLIVSRSMSSLTRPPCKWWDRTDSDRRNLERPM